MHATYAIRLPSPKLFVALVTGGLVADLAWEVWARAITPLIIGGPLEPAALILSLFRLPEAYYLHAEVLHVITGLVFYPLVFWAIRTWLYAGTRFVDGLIIGVFTWILALGVFAPLAGLPFMLGFVPLSFMSGIGHVLYGLALSYAFRAVARDA